MSAPSAAQGPLSFLLDGARVSLAAGSEPPHRTLLQWLRATGRTASKEGCAEGDCGACTVLLLDRDGQGNPTWRAINACIALLATMHEREIVTAAGLGLLAGEKVDGFAEALHPVQQAMIRRYGSQCGYCTPGMVMSAVDLCKNHPNASEGEIRELLEGNICRCTGYQNIVRAVQVGGPLGAYLPESQFDMPLDYEAFAAIGGGLGHGGIASATSQNWPKLELIFLTQAKMQCSINSQAYTITSSAEVLRHRRDKTDTEIVARRRQIPRRASSRQNMVD